ncbi:hypothetical protein [Anditalea andensis]|uniref:Uncharacterized protein n=1 Tax=Anditalea andensis TaxID=1048983 RepID=A0A074KUD8_9BACT|nr:hypothetical protein [Anditalea andensis]KEO72524.1 hypothetical protein EL17_17460 [Anditalea andensis]
MIDIEDDINCENFISIDSIYYLWTPIPANQRLDLIKIPEFNRYHLIKKSGDDIEYFLPYQYGVALDENFYPIPVDGDFNLSPILGSEIEFIYSEYYKNITNIRETGGYIYFNCFRNGLGRHLLFDSNKKNIISKGGAKEKINVKIITADSKYFYGYIFPTVYNELKNKGKSVENHPLLKDLEYTKFELDENPIIIKFHIPSPK